MTATGPQGEKLTWYVSHDVAVNGLVRIEKDGETFLEVLDWGHKTPKRESWFGPSDE